jgi:arginine N-succinyltransferase
MKMLEREGFESDGYVDIFDGGPTMSVDTDDVRTIRESRELVYAAPLAGEGGQKALLAAGTLRDFVACYGRFRACGEDEAELASESAKLLGLEPGATFLAMAR